MERWHNKENIFTVSKDVDAFLDEIVAVCEKHGLSISHEDRQGAFEIEMFSAENIDWLRHAHKAY